MAGSIEIPRSCPCCVGKLWKHGRFRRIAKDLTRQFLVEVLRLFCAACRVTFSLLPDFLDSKKMYTRDVREQYVQKFVFDGESYREVAWSDIDGEREDASASLSRVFRSIEECSEAASEMYLQLQESALEDGLVDHDVEIALQSRNEVSARSAQKRVNINVLCEVFKLLVRIKERGRLKISAGYRQRALVYRLPTPQRMKHLLF